MLLLSKLLYRGGLLLSEFCEARRDVGRRVLRFCKLLGLLFS